ncbi:MAG TPA: antibiotic biosynthesis monooxygenase [Candidatus Thermoplasmatota archaeon]
MILRTFRTKANPSTIPAYERFEETEGIPMVRGMKGCVAAGFGNVPDSEGRYLFFSIWENAKAIEEARATPPWKTTVAKLEASKFTIGDAVVEQVELSAYGAVAMESTPSGG